MQQTADADATTVYLEAATAAVSLFSSYYYAADAVADAATVAAVWEAAATTAVLS